MAIDDNTTYGLTGAQLTDLAGKVKTAGTTTVELEESDLNLNTLTAPGTYYITDPGGRYYISNNDLHDAGDYIQAYGPAYLIALPTNTSGTNMGLFLNGSSGSGVKVLKWSEDTFSATDLGA